VVKQAAAAAAFAKPSATNPLKANSPDSFAPIVTSLGKVGGGGYSSGTLDAQRENNRLTGETNRLLQDMNLKIGKLGGGGLAAFG
jgi:hypothetical protein